MAIFETKTEVPLTPRKENSAIVAFFPGLASLVGDLLLYPMDTINVRIKAEKKIHQSFTSGVLAYYKSDGLSGFYRGWTSTLPNGFLATFLFFYSYEKINSLAKKVSESRWKYPALKQAYDFTFPFLTSGIAQLLTLSFYIPVDTIRTRMQICDSRYDYKGIIDGAMKIHGKEGLWRLYSVSHVFILSFCLFSSLEFGIYESLRKFYLQKMGKNSLSTAESVIGASVAAFAASVIINPLDLIIVRHQISDSSSKKVSAAKILKDVIRKEGPSALLKGLSARAYYNITFAILDIPLYEYFRKEFGVELWE